MRVFPTSGFVRLKDILAPVGPIPVSKSTWYCGVKSGRFPHKAEGDPLGARISAWRAEDIRALFERPDAGAANTETPSKND